MQGDLAEGIGHLSEEFGDELRIVETHSRGVSSQDIVRTTL